MLNMLNGKKTNTGTLMLAVGAVLGAAEKMDPGMIPEEWQWVIQLLMGLGGALAIFGIRHKQQRDSAPAAPAPDPEPAAE